MHHAMPEHFDRLHLFVQRGDCADGSASMTEMGRPPPPGRLDSTVQMDDRRAHFFFRGDRDRDFVRLAGGSTPNG